MVDKNTYQHLYLSEIVKRDIPGITKILAAQHMEACLICLDHHHHQTGIKLSLKDNLNQILHLYWDEMVTEQMRRSWKDMQDATENGAVAIAIVLVLNYTPYTIIERSVKGTGFDYWLLEEEILNELELFPDGTARLEVSGILHAEKDNEIYSRIKDKKKQISVSDNMGLPGIIVVVEFSRPEAYMVLKQ